MKQSGKLSFRKGDWFAIAGVLVLGIVVAVLFGTGNANKKAEVIQIYQNNQLLMEYSFDTDEIISVDGEYHNKIQISGGRVSFVESDCPGADCVHSGWIDQPGRSIVCLPNKVEVRIVGTTDEVDIIVR